MRANEDMMPKLSICHGHGSKMNFSVSDYIRGNTAYLSLHHLWSEKNNTVKNKKKCSVQWNSENQKLCT